MGKESHELRRLEYLKAKRYPKEWKVREREQTHPPIRKNIISRILWKRWREEMYYEEETLP